ncbi:hypothetical protein FRUB_00070 [Fimbriiglobus ruber]|uniref:Uncharacterized protein n=1 Tax=Fimbriiglobus ruber TaxID=1908690 RepID=A0A225DYD4_9BACT|nr:hypothetical protein FRUB_00070 [Fimbriiglobus ruber]
MRQLPLPAKLVISVFLIAVGIGYFSALVQLHMQHSGRNGEPMPTPWDVIEKFSGLKPHDGQVAKSKIEGIVSGPKDGAFDKNNMAPAFFGKSGKVYEKDCTTRGQDKVDAEREGERQTLIAWINADPDERKTAYEKDDFKIPDTLSGRPITEEFADKATGTAKIKSIIEERCVRCHGGDKKPDLDEYPKLLPLISVPKVEILENKYLGDKWVRTNRQLSVEGLTQSTHAHLLSFSVLFALTGLTFAFTSYPAFVRCILGPIVLLATVADIACWWLARLDEIGPVFALAIMGTGATAGLGLAAQIILSLFNMYGIRGKIVLWLLFAAAIAGFGLLASKVILPALREEESAAKKAIEAANKKEPAKADDGEAKKDNPANGGDKKAQDEGDKKKDKDAGVEEGEKKKDKKEDVKPEGEKATKAEAEGEKKDKKADVKPEGEKKATKAEAEGEKKDKKAGVKQIDKPIPLSKDD